MVDPVGAKPATSVDRSIAPVVRNAPLAPIPAPGRGEGDQATASTIATIARDYASVPPVDQDRVARIRRAIANGTYPILPETVADRLIALRLDWNPHEPA